MQRIISIILCIYTNFIYLYTMKINIYSILGVLVFINIIYTFFIKIDAQTLFGFKVEKEYYLLFNLILFVLLFIGYYKKSIKTR